MDPVGEALWARVLEDWEDDARHTAFLTHCQMSQALGVAASRYRAIAEDAEAYRSAANRSEDAKKRLVGITTLAVLVMQASATPPEEAKRPARWLVVVAVGMLSGAAAVLVRACS